MTDTNGGAWTMSDAIGGDLRGVLEADGLSSDMRETVDELIATYQSHQARNAGLRKLYEGKAEVRVHGDLVSASSLENKQVCYWPEKVVDHLADRIRVTGFGALDEDAARSIARIADSNRLATSYQRHLSSKLMHGCMFATVNNDNGASVRFHSAETAVGIADDNYDSGILKAGLAIARADAVPWAPSWSIPTQVNVYTPGAVTVIERYESDRWHATTMPVPERNPMMFAFTHRSTGTKPFGKSRITPAVRSLTESAVQTMWFMQIAGIFYSMPQRYLLGLSDEMYDAMASSKTKAYLDSMLLGTKDGDGTVPTYGQLPANSPQPFIDQLNYYASQLSGATGVPLSSLGVTYANPTSADAIQASREDICLVAEGDIAADRESLKRVLLCALAVDENTSTERLGVATDALTVDFENPMLSSLAARADAASKWSAMDEGFAGSPIFYDWMGVSEDQRRQQESWRRRQQGMRLAIAVNENRSGEPQSGGE